MKKIGMIGGMSWESTTLYYQLINRKVKEFKGGFHSANCIIESFDFSEIQALQAMDNWEQLDALMVERAKYLEDSGAELLLICANTMHLSVDAIKKNVSIPIVHIARATGDKIKDLNMKKVALLGTKFTMERDFFKKILTEEFDLEVIVPENDERNQVHNIIYKELVLGVIEEDSKKFYLKIIEQLKERGAEGIILGCTEIPLLIHATDVDIPLFDTTNIHAEKAVELALK